jgi:hypothetical protein
LSKQIPSDCAGRFYHSNGKLHEELITKSFSCQGGWLGQKIKELALLAHEEDAHGIKLKLQEIVPEYHPFDLSNSPQTGNK